ncbi:MAG: hypothetical protein ACPHDJ_08275, partial [Candidatus Puniceispirillaceae bacterium]
VDTSYQTARHNEPIDPSVLPCSCGDGCCLFIDDGTFNFNCADGDRGYREFDAPSISDCSG